MRSVEAIEALPARRDRADDDALTDAILAVEPGPDRVNHADRFVAEDEAGPHGILAADDMHVRATDRRRRNSYDRFSGAWCGLAYLFNADAAFPLEYDGFHQCHDESPGQTGHPRPTTTRNANVVPGVEAGLSASDG